MNSRHSGNMKTLAQPFDSSSVTGANSLPEPSVRSHLQPAGPVCGGAGRLMSRLICARWRGVLDLTLSGRAAPADVVSLRAEGRLCCPDARPRPHTRGVRYVLAQSTVERKARGRALPNEALQRNGRPEWCAGALDGAPFFCVHHQRRPFGLHHR